MVHRNIIICAGWGGGPWAVRDELSALPTKLLVNIQTLSEYRLKSFAKARGMRHKM